MDKKTCLFLHDLFSKLLFNPMDPIEQSAKNESMIFETLLVYLSVDEAVAFLNEISNNLVVNFYNWRNDECYKTKKILEEAQQRLNRLK